MTRIRIVTDSTADLSAALRNEFDIAMVPLQVRFGEESFEDQVTLQASEFYQKLVDFDGVPRTSQPSPAQFLSVFEQILHETPQATIISLLISSQLSGTYQSALLAKSMLDESQQNQVILIDTKTASVGFNIAVLALAKAIQAGKSLEACLAIVDAILKQKKLYFIVDTLNFLHKNGRIGGASAFVGSLLQVKPILSISEEGTVYSVDKARGSSRAIRRIIELLEADFRDKPICLAIAHANAREEAERLAAQLAEKFQVNDIQYTEIGPVIGAHGGPGTLAVVAYER